MSAMWDLSRESGGDFVGAVDISLRLDETALALGLNGVLEDLERRGLAERGQAKDGFWGDRPTHVGLVGFGLVPATRVITD